MAYIDVLARITTGLVGEAAQLLDDRDLPDWHKDRVARFRTKMLAVLQVLQSFKPLVAHMNISLVGQYSHELRTPLCGINYLELILHDSEVQDGPTMNQIQRETVSQMLGTGRQLLFMVNNLLDYSRIFAGELVIYPEVFDLHFIFGEIDKLLQINPGFKVMPVELAQEPVWVKADRMRTQALIYMMCFGVFEQDVARHCKVMPSIAIQDFVDLVFSFPATLYSARELHKSIDEQRALENDSLNFVLAKMLTEFQEGEFRFETIPEAGTRILVALPAAKV